MAIYSLHHSPVGKSTQAQPYTAAAHIGYITRKRAMSGMDKARMPGGNPREIARYLRECEDGDRKNARVIDKVMLALPRELNSTQRVQLVRDFAEHVTRGKAPWLAAFHAKGKDARNPHCHLVIRDRDPATGKRIIGTSEIGSTERLRQQWELFANRALARAGYKERIDRRTLKAQGIDREPTVHEGPQAQAMDRRGVTARSRPRRVRNRPGSCKRYRDVDYRRIDRGRSRPQLNRERRTSAPETEKDFWSAIDQDAVMRELGELARIHKGSSQQGGVIPLPARRGAAPSPEKPAARGGAGHRKAASGQEQSYGQDKHMPHGVQVQSPKFGKQHHDDRLGPLSGRGKDLPVSKDEWRPREQNRHKAVNHGVRRRDSLDGPAGEVPTQARRDHAKAGGPKLMSRVGTNPQPEAKQKIDSSHVGRKTQASPAPSDVSRSSRLNERAAQAPAQAVTPVGPEPRPTNASDRERGPKDRPMSFRQKLRSMPSDPGRDERSLKKLARGREEDKERGR